MKIIKIDRKENSFEVEADSFDDLWHLEKLIEAGDLVSGSSERKIKPKNEGEKAFRQKVFLEIEAEEAEFHEASGELRVNGIVVSSNPEEAVELKSHHTIEVMPGTRIRVKKKALKNYHVERLERAKDSSGRGKLLVVVMDDEEAELAFLKDTGFESRARILAKKGGKRFEESAKGNDYFTEILAKIKELAPEKTIVAGPGFEKQNFEKFLGEKSEKLKPFFESTNSVGATGLNELVKSGKIDRLIEGLHSAKEAKAIERLLECLPKGLSAVGFGETKNAVSSGAAEKLLVSERLIAEERQKTSELVDAAEASGAEIIFVSQKTDAGKKLDGLGGIAAILRYKSNWV